MTDDEFTRAQGGKHRGTTRNAPYPLSRLAPPHDLVDMAREIQVADSTIKSHVKGKLKIIADQIRSLQAEARSILEGAQRDTDIHRAVCHFKKRAGHIYHVYEHSEGHLYLSRARLRLIGATRRRSSGFAPPSGR